MANPFLVLGGIAVGIVTAGFGILQVPGWVASAQDAAAINDLGSAAIGQAASINQGHGYKSGDSFGDFLAESGVKVDLSGGVKLCVTTNTEGTAYAAVALSPSGAFFARTPSVSEAAKGSTAAEALANAGGAPAGVPAPFDGADCAPDAEVAPPAPGGPSDPGPSVPAGADAAFTLRCDATTLVILPLAGAQGTATWSDGVVAQTAPGEWPAGQLFQGVPARTLQAGVEYTVSFEGTFPQLGAIGYSGAPYFNQDMWDCFRSMDAWSEDAGTTIAINAFRDMRNLTGMPAAIPSTVTEVDGMFRNATSFNDARVAGWNVSNIDWMYDMFNGATAFNQDLSGWNVKAGSGGGNFAPHLSADKLPRF